MNNEWYNPPDIITRIWNVLGGIDLDPASCEKANSIVMAKYFFTKEDSGLNKDWFGRVFLNPPYSAKLIKQFMLKAVIEYSLGNVSEMIILTNSGTDTLWNEIIRKNLQAYTHGRLSFIDGETMKIKKKVLEVNV